jgi:hypothetical protein
MSYREKYSNGFLIAKSHSIDLSFLEEFYDLWTDFFLSNEKVAFGGDLKVPVGYFGLEKNGITTQHEDFYYFPNSTLCPSYLRNITNYFFSNFKKFTTEFIRSENFSTLNQENTLYLMRIIFYNYSYKTKCLEELNPSHTDKSYFTILPPASSAGLQYKESSVWKDLPLNEDEVLLVFGDKLSNLIPPLEHRVINNTQMDHTHRISMAFFVS